MDYLVEGIGAKYEEIDKVTPGTNPSGEDKKALAKPGNSVLGANERCSIAKKNCSEKRGQQAENKISLSNT